MKRFWLLLFITMPHWSHGADLPATIQPELISDFGGGLNTRDPSDKLENSYSPYMRNVFIDNGKIERINGFVTLGSSRTLFRVTGIFPYVRENGQTTFLVTDSSITIETSDFKTYIPVSSNANVGSLLTWMQVRNKMWGFNGIDSVMSWDGITRTFLTWVPKFKYGAYYQDRVWGFALPAAASDLAFSSVITTDSVIIAPDDLRAWPAINLLHVGQGDGEIGTALWVYDQLRAGKERSIYTIYGDAPSAYQPRKEQTNIGVVSNESVVVMDGETHLLAQNGVHRNTQRVSDLIQPDIDLINKGVTQLLQNTWDTQADFARGQFFGTTATPAGLLLGNRGQTYRANNAPTPPSDSGFVQFVGTGVFDTGFTSLTILTANKPPGDFVGIPGRLQLWARVNNALTCGGAPSLRVQFRNIATGQTGNQNAGQSISAWTAGAFTLVDMGGLANNTSWDSEEIRLSSVAIKLELSQAPNSGCVFEFYTATTPGAATLDLYSSSRTQFLSEISTINMVTAWGIFDSINNTNGGTLSLFVRTSTSLVNIATQVWVNISPGATLGFPTQNRFIQWASTFVADGTTPNIDNVVISHIEGQSTDARAFAIDRENRYWLAVTTTSNSAQRLIYVKSQVSNTPNHDAWMAIEGPSVGCFAKSGNVFYAGAASTGIIYRMDYGTNFDGAPIPSIYDTPDMPLGTYFFDKYIQKYLIEGDKSVGGGTMTVRTSRDQGNFTASTFSITGSGRYLRGIEGVTGNVSTVRLRLENGETDVGFGVNLLGVLYEPKKSFRNK